MKICRTGPQLVFTAFSANKRVTACYCSQANVGPGQTSRYVGQCLNLRFCHDLHRLSIGQLPEYAIILKQSRSHTIQYQVNDLKNCFDAPPLAWCKIIFKKEEGESRAGVPLRVFGQWPRVAGILVTESMKSTRRAWSSAFCSGVRLKLKNNFIANLHILLQLKNASWTVGCSDFYFFHILRYNHPSLTP